MTISRQSQKLAISFIVVLGLSLAMIIFDLSRMHTMQSKLDIITKEHNIKSELMSIVRYGMYERQIILRNIMLIEDPFERDIGATKLNNSAVYVLEARRKFSKMPLSKEEEVLLKEINIAMEIAYRAQIKLIENSIYEEDKKITQKELQGTFRIQEILMAKVRKMISLQKEATNKAVMDAEESYQEAKFSVYILGGTSLLFGFLVALLVIRLTESQARYVKQAMLDLEESRHSLEDRVKDRTKELALARDVALASNKAKDIFLANMSHELRTPLNIILGYSELLEETAREENVRDFVPDLIKIQHAAHHQLELISSILDISKIEEGKLEIHSIEFDIEKLLFEIEEAATPLMSKNHNTFTINCTHGIGMMYSDNIRIRQILLNLLSNAAKFTKQGTVSLNVSKGIGGSEIIFEVKDTGVGITKDYMHDLFEKFSQADSTTTRQYGGTGLGLAISKQLSNSLNGDITVTSDEGIGACFTLTLPIIFSS